MFYKADDPSVQGVTGSWDFKSPATKRYTCVQALLRIVFTIKWKLGLTKCKWPQSKNSWLVLKGHKIKLFFNLTSHATPVRTLAGEQLEYKFTHVFYLTDDTLHTA